MTSPRTRWSWTTPSDEPEWKPASPALLAGMAVAAMCFELTAERFDGMIEFKEVVGDGGRVEAGEVLARIEGPLAPILTAERTALNLLARLCRGRDDHQPIRGCDCWNDYANRGHPQNHSRDAELAEIRSDGRGGSNHRFGLDDGILIKDNRLVAAGGCTEALARARSGAPHGLRIEVEVATLEELKEALDGGAEAILLDNMSPETVAEGGSHQRRAGSAGGLGRINLDTVRSCLRNR